MIQYMIVVSLETRIFCRLYGSQVIMENRWLHLKILWSDMDNLVDRPKSQSPVEQTGRCPVCSISSAWAGPVHSIRGQANGLSSEWLRHISIAKIATHFCKPLCVNPETCRRFPLYTSVRVLQVARG